MACSAREAEVQIPEQLREAIEDDVRRSLSTELDARGLLLAGPAAASATADAARSGAALLHRVLAHCYAEGQQGGPAMAVEFDSVEAAAHIGLALTFGSVTARLLMPPQRTGHESADSVDLLCAVFNQGIGMIDGLCDGAPQLGLHLLRILEALDLSDAACNKWAAGQLRSALPRSLAADPTVAFTARVVEAFFDLLHSAYPGDQGVALRRRVGAQLAEALEAERTSIDRADVFATYDQLVECSRRTSVLPFQIIELLASGDDAPTGPTAGTLLGEAMWRIDDLVDLTQDARTGALNGVLLAATQEPPDAAGSNGSVVSALERVLASRGIPVASAQAAEFLDAGLKAAPGSRAADDDRSAFLSFVQSYAGIGSGGELRRGPRT
jgi:hypothetical protein